MTLPVDAGYLLFWICGAAFTLGASMDFVFDQLKKRNGSFDVWFSAVGACLLFWPFMLGLTWREK
jgi:hypothetical protein